MSGETRSPDPQDAERVRTVLRGCGRSCWASIVQRVRVALSIIQRDVRKSVASKIKSSGFNLFVQAGFKELFWAANVPMWMRSTDFAWLSRTLRPNKESSSLCWVQRKPESGSLRSQLRRMIFSYGWSNMKYPKNTWKGNYWNCMSFRWRRRCPRTSWKRSWASDENYKRLLGKLSENQIGKYGAQKKRRQERVWGNW